MFGLLNIGSLVLGLLAWSLPIIALLRNTKNWAVISMLSFSACGLSLCFQILAIYHLVRIEDFGAMMDTMYAIAFAATTLLIVTIILNMITLNVYRNKITH